MDLRLALGVVCGVSLVGGGAAMKWVYARRAARARGISAGNAMANGAWLRDDAGRFRWSVAVWYLFWLASLLLTTAL